MATPKFFNLAQMTSTTSGLGPVTLTSNTLSYRTFIAAGASNGDTVRYNIYDQNLNQREYGLGVLTIVGTVVTMSRIFGGSTTGFPLVLSGNAIVSLSPTAEDFSSPTFTAASWNIVIAASAVAAAVPKTLYEVTGAAGPFTISLPLTAVTNDAVAVYMRDYTSTVVVTVDAGLGGTIADFGQTHRLGVWHTFMVYRCTGPQTWIVEWDAFTKELRYKASNAVIGVLHGNSLLYMDSTMGVRTITIPSNTTDPLPVGFQCEVMRYGGFDVTLVADVGVTIDQGAPLTLPTIYSRGVLTKVNPNEWAWNLYGSAESPSQRVITASPYAPSYSDDYVFINTVGTAVINLPSVASRMSNGNANGKPIRLKDMSGIVGHIMNRNGTDVFEGGFTSFTFYTAYQGQNFVPTIIGGIGTWAVM